MNAKDNYYIVIYILLSVVAIALSIFLTKCIVNSNLPLWLKVVLLR